MIDPINLAQNFSLNTFECGIGTVQVLVIK